MKPAKTGAALVSLPDAPPEYHQTEIHTFVKCGKLWEFRYARNLKIPPRAALTVGSSVDTAVSYNLVQKTESGVDAPKKEVLDCFSTDFERRRTETDWRDDDPGEQKDIGARLVEAHHAQVAPRIQPATVQERFRVETDQGYALGGTIDFTEKSGIVADTKTARAAYSEDSIRRAIQPALYDFAYEQIHGKPAAGFRYDVLIKPTARNPARVQQIQDRITAADRGWLFDTINQVHRAIQAGVALPAPEGSWYCSPEWCGFWKMCKGKNKKGP